MNAKAQWTFDVPSDVDDDVRILLEKRGDCKKTLAEYVIDLVEQDLLRAFLSGELRPGNGMTEDEAMELAMREVKAYRREKPLGLHKYAA